MGSDLYAWLARHNLSEYAELLESNRVGVDILSSLTEQDLKDLGIPLGDRKRFAIAIGRADAEDSDVGAVRPSTDDASPPESERRQQTIMFCDLVGSTVIAERYDQEDYGEILRAYEQCCRRIIEERFGGTVIRFEGDGVHSLFGHPQADETDATRAIWAGLAIIDEVSNLEPCGEHIQVRVGIATGSVVVGAIVGTGAATEMPVLGKATPLAKRLEGLAEPDTMVIADETRALAPDFFEYVDLGYRQLTGFAKPIRAWRVVRQSAVRTPSEAVHVATDLTPLVGRQREVDWLRHLWQDAIEGRGQVALITGDAGIGKSRLADTLSDDVTLDGHTILRYYCSPYYKNTALYPVIEQLKRAVGFSASESAAQRLENLEAFLAQTGDDTTQTVSLFAYLLSIPTEGRYETLNLTPEERKLKTLGALQRHLAVLSEHKPVLVIFEDLHWSDPTTLELLDGFIEQVSALPTLMLLTKRRRSPDSNNDRLQQAVEKWSGGGVWIRTLPSLSPENSTKVLDYLRGPKSLPEGVGPQIIEKTDGIPLFIEEMFKALVHGGSLKEETDCYVLDGTVPTLDVPGTLADSLMARLDRLGSVKEVAQVAAVIGREFSYDLLRAVSNLSKADLDEAIVRLSDAEVIHHHSFAYDESYTFKHALLQDAAYSSLLRSKRESLHARIAELLEKNYPEHVEHHPELLAYHFYGAKLPDRAVEYWEQAGRHAVRRYANVEAVDHIGKALKELETLPAGPDRDRRELVLLLLQGPALTATEGFATPMVEWTYSRVLELCPHVGDASDKFSALRGLWVCQFIRANLQSALNLAGELLELGEQEQHKGYLLEAHRALGQTLLYLGDFVASHAHLQQGLELYDERDHREHVQLYGNDPGVACRVYHAYVSWFLGYPDQALAQSERAVSKARELGHPFSVAYALAFATYLHQHVRDVEGTKEYAERTIALARERQFPFWQHQETILHGWALVEQGDTATGFEELERGMDNYHKGGAALADPWFEGLLAEALSKDERETEALESLEKSIDIAKHSSEGFFVAEAHRLQGELMLKQRGLEAAIDAERCFRQSLKVAREQRARSWELRAAVSLGRLWQSTGNLADARNLVGPVFEAFTEGFATRDLIDAESLLDDLRKS